MNSTCLATLSCRMSNSCRHLADDIISMFEVDNTNSYFSCRAPSVNLSIFVCTTVLEFYKHSEIMLVNIGMLNRDKVDFLHFCVTCILKLYFFYDLYLYNIMALVLWNSQMIRLDVHSADCPLLYKCLDLKLLELKKTKKNKRK